MKCSIKIKWTVFIILLLAVSIMCTGFFMLKGIVVNQKDYYEELLLESSKTANLYIRERYVSEDYKDFSLFYREEAENLEMNLRRIIHMPLALYDAGGEILSSGENIVSQKQLLNIMKLAIKDKIIYEKQGNQIIYLAPIYDFDTQIGVLKIIYSMERENELYERLRLLFLKIALMFISIALFIGISYFSKITKIISKLKQDVESIETGDYVATQSIKSKDELGDLNRGIVLMANKIKQNMDDLTREKNKLELALNKLQRLEKQQKEFIGNITHEFKTPLTVIKAQIDLITMYTDDKEMVEKSKTVADKELKRMDNMIENILYLSKLEKYDFEFKREKVNTKELLEDICYRMEGKATKFGITLSKELEQIYILIDRESFMQIFINLIDNAIKYNKHRGKVCIRSYREGGNNVIEVEDTGIGIPKELKDRIFEPFFTVDKNRSKQFAGTGLGLSVVYKLIKRQNGNIVVLESKNGTLFKITFYASW